MACSRFNIPNSSFALSLVAANRLAQEPDPKAVKNAETIYKKIIQHDSESIDGLNDYAQFLYQHERFSESAVIFENMLSIDPLQITALNNLAWILATHLDKNNRALQLTEQGLELHPNYPDLIDTRGVVYYQLGKYQKSQQDFETCLTLYPRGHASLAGAYLRLAKSLVALKQTDQAKMRLVKALAIHQEKTTLTDSEFQQANRLLTQLQ